MIVVEVVSAPLATASFEGAHPSHRTLDLSIDYASTNSTSSTSPYLMQAMRVSDEILEMENGRLKASNHERAELRGSKSRGK